MLVFSSLPYFSEEEILQTTSFFQTEKKLSIIVPSGSCVDYVDAILSKEDNFLNKYQCFTLSFLSNNVLNFKSTLILRCMSFAFWRKHESLMLARFESFAKCEDFMAKVATLNLSADDIDDTAALFLKERKRILSLLHIKEKETVEREIVRDLISKIYCGEEFVLLHPDLSNPIVFDLAYAAAISKNSAVVLFAPMNEYKAIIGPFSKEIEILRAIASSIRYPSIYDFCKLKYSFCSLLSTDHVEDFLSTKDIIINDNKLFFLEGSTLSQSAKVAMNFLSDKTGRVNCFFSSFIAKKIFRGMLRSQKYDFYKNNFNFSDSKIFIFLMLSLRVAETNKSFDLIILIRFLLENNALLMNNIEVILSADRDLIRAKSGIYINDLLVSANIRGHPFADIGLSVYESVKPLSVLLNGNNSKLINVFDAHIEFCCAKFLNKENHIIIESINFLKKNRYISEFISEADAKSYKFYLKTLSKFEDLNLQENNPAGNYSYFDLLPEVGSFIPANVIILDGLPQFGDISFNIENERSAINKTIDFLSSIFSMRVPCLFLSDLSNKNSSLISRIRFISKKFSPIKECYPVYFKNKAVIKMQPSSMNISISDIFLLNSNPHCFLLEKMLGLKDFGSLDCFVSDYYLGKDITDAFREILKQILIGKNNIQVPSIPDHLVKKPYAAEIYRTRIGNFLKLILGKTENIDNIEFKVTRDIIISMDSSITIRVEIGSDITLINKDGSILIVIFSRFDDNKENSVIRAQAAAYSILKSIVDKDKLPIIQVESWNIAKCEARSIINSSDDIYDLCENFKDYLKEVGTRISEGCFSVTNLTSKNDRGNDKYSNEIFKRVIQKSK